MAIERRCGGVDSLSALVHSRASHFCAKDMSQKVSVDVLGGHAGGHAVTCGCMLQTRDDVPYMYLFGVGIEAMTR